MIRVPSYQLIPFLSWLHRRGLQLSIKKMDPIRLQELAKEFLIHSHCRAVYSLAGIMSIFQNCPDINDWSVEKQMDHFVNCGKCIEIFASSSVTPWSINVNTTQLHPLVREFVKCSRDSELENSLRHIENQFLLDRDSFSYEFRYLINEIGSDLRSHFYRYLSEVRDQNPSLIDGYERFRLENRKLERKPSRYCRHKSIQPIGLDETTEQAANRLAQTVYWGIKQGIYNDQVFDYNLFLRRGTKSPENLAQTLEFLQWLQHEEPEIKMPGSIPSTELKGLALQFCEESGYNNGESFSKEVNKWLTGKGSNQITNSIARFLKLNNPSDESNSLPEQLNPLDRYNTVSFHALFLFLSSDKFIPNFIKTHWRDLNHLTGNDLDIYFSQKDLSKQTSGYEIINNLKSVPLPDNPLPTLLLWEDRLENNYMIPLQGLDYEGIIEVVQTVIQAIRNQYTIENIVKCGKSRSIELKNEHEDEILIREGGIKSMKKVVIQGDVIGTVIGSGSIKDSIAIKVEKETHLEKMLTAEDIIIIKDIKDALMDKEIKGIEDSKRIEGVLYLARIVEAKNKSDQEENLAGWKRWLDSLGERSKNVLSVLADLVTVVSPIAPLLGLQF